MLKVGITGGIGAGKTLVTGIFQNLGIHVYDSDSEAKNFLSDEQVKSKLRNYFGEIIFDNTQNIDKKKLAEIVFNDPVSLKYLNLLIHPLVREHFKKWCQLHNSNPYIIFEAAILFESGFNKDVDKTITIFAPEEVRIARIKKRDGMSEQEVLERMKNQMKDEQIIKLSDFVIYNDDEHLVIPQVLKIHKELIAFSN